MPRRARRGATKCDVTQPNATSFNLTHAAAEQSHGFLQTVDRHALPHEKPFRRHRWT
jgi:hypothetical protein